MFSYRGALAGLETTDDASVSGMKNGIILFEPKCTSFEDHLYRFLEYS